MSYDTFRVEVEVLVARCDGPYGSVIFFVLLALTLGSWGGVGRLSPLSAIVELDTEFSLVMLMRSPRIQLCRVVMLSFDPLEAFMS